MRICLNFETPFWWRLDSSASLLHYRRRRFMLPSMAMGAKLTQKRTPLEQAAFEQTSRGRYEKAQREAGLVKTTLWVPADALAEVRYLVKCLVNLDGSKLADLRALTSKWEHER